MIEWALIDKTTQISDHSIHAFAFFTFSSSHIDTKYIIQLIIIAITDITATRLITICIKLAINTAAVFSNPASLAVFGCIIFSCLLQGRPNEFKGGGSWTANKVLFHVKHEIIIKKVSVIFFIKFIILLCI